MKKFFKYKPEDQDLFKDVVFLVEATYNETLTFWRDHFNEPRKYYRVVKWEDESLGHIIQIGVLDDRPVNISIHYAKLNGYRVMFYEACSQVVDYEMVEKWLKHFSLETIRWDNNLRWAHANSSNFHLCINAIEDFDKLKVGT